MKRSEIIKQLMNEGFSERTLVNFSDKQLVSLSSRILGEQTASVTTSGPGNGSVNVSSKNPNTKNIITNLQRQGIKNINVTEEGKLSGLNAKKEVKEGGVPGLTAKKSSGELKNGTAEKEMKESGVPGLTAKKSSGELKNGTAEKEMKESGVPGLTAKKSSGQLKNGTSEKEMKESGVPGLKAKVVKEAGVPGLTAKKSSGELKNGTAEKEMKESAGAMPGLTVKGKTNIAKPTDKPGKEEGEEDINEKKPSAGLSKEKKSEVVKKAKAGEDIGNKGKGFNKVVAAAKKGGAKDPKAVAASAMWKNIKREGKEINEWVEDVAKKHYHPFASKGDIMEMISNKMEEMREEGGENKLPGFLKAKAIKGSGEVTTAPAQPKTKPITKPGTKPVVKPTPKTPYKPGPGTNPHPKSGLRAEEEEISEAPKTNNIPVVKPGGKI